MQTSLEEIREFLTSMNVTFGEVNRTENSLRVCLVVAASTHSLRVDFESKEDFYNSGRILLSEPSDMSERIHFNGKNDFYQLFEEKIARIKIENCFKKTHLINQVIFFSNLKNELRSKGIKIDIQKEKIVSMLVEQFNLNNHFELEVFLEECNIYAEDNYFIFQPFLEKETKEKFKVPLKQFQFNKEGDKING